MKSCHFFSDWKLLSLQNLFVVFTLTTVFFILSCSKDDDGGTPQPKVYAEENPFDVYIEKTGFGEYSSHAVNASMNYEFGLTFSPNVKGTINAITVKLPDINSNLRVTIWDYIAETVLRTEMVNVSATNTLITKKIEKLVLEKDKKYVITMNSNDWYDRYRLNSSEAPYPITAGNIKIWDHRYTGGNAQVFPTAVVLNYNSGDLSFNFQQVD